MSSAVGKRRTPLPLVPGKRAEIREDDLAERARALADLAEAKRRLTNAVGRIRRQLGDAEIGTLNGQPVIWRQQSTTGGTGYVRVNHRDDIRDEPPA